MMYSSFIGNFEVASLQMKEMLDCYFSKKSFNPLPLLQGLSEREKKVYEGLTKIPLGKTMCYSDFANMIGLAGVRRVASLIGKNPFPIVIPCHRVIKKNGELGEYSFLEGTKTKKLLIDYEKLY